MEILERGDNVVLRARPGELALIMRALRSYMCAEQQAIQDAWMRAKQTRRTQDALHADDVRQHAQARIDAASAVLSSLQTPRHRIGKVD